jgi:hypothetical protein
MQSVTDTFFYEELCASMGPQGASNWLLTAHATQQALVDKSRDCCKRDRPDCVFTTLPNATGIQSQEVKVQWNRVMVEDVDINKLANELGVSPGLIFTDAAHILLDRKLDRGYHPESHLIQHPCSKDSAQHLRISQRARARSSPSCFINISNE